MSDKELQLKLLYYGHSLVDMQLLGGALESDGIDYLVKRDVGLPDMAPGVFFFTGYRSKALCGRYRLV